VSTVKQITELIDEVSIKQRIERGKRGKWWRRVGKSSRSFRYLDHHDNRIVDEMHLTRIKSLVIPPAWKYVRISPSARNSIQALGMDAFGRIQYLYHPKFTEKQKVKKFSKIERFGEYLPALRRATNEHIALDGFPREKVLAIMMRLINSLYIRVGTEKSVKQYKTFGITTLQNRHLTIGKNGSLIFEFVGKHHIKHRNVLVDAELAAVLQQLKAVGAARKLFHYLDENGKAHVVKPQDINRYLKTFTAPEYSAKDFRTWGGSLMAAVELAELGRAESESQLKKNIVKAVKRVAEKLGNTPTVCRGSYVHPTVLSSYQSGVTIDQFRPRKSRRLERIESDYQPEELALMSLFKNFGNGHRY